MGESERENGSTELDDANDESRSPGSRTPRSANTIAWIPITYILSPAVDASSSNSNREDSSEVKPPARYKAAQTGPGSLATQGPKDEMLMRVYYLWNETWMAPFATEEEKKISMSFFLSSCPLPPPVTSETTERLVSHL